MDASQLLKTFLQVHLASDTNATLHLPYVLTTLTAEALQSSEHIQKWIARTSSLMLSKDAGARWAGLCIALQTANLSRDLMVECAQTWVGAAIPLLSRSEPIPTHKVAIRLLRRVFTGAMDVPEYQRQVCTPNVPKFSLAIASLGETTADEELKVVVFDTLTHLIPTYPALHRASQTALTNFAMLYLNGSAPQSLPAPVVKAASRFYAVLHHTGGKVGGASQWRKAVDETLAFCWDALSSIRTTFPAENSGTVSVSNQGDPVVGVPLGLDRLSVGVQVLQELMHSSNLRPVVLPIGSIVKLCVALLRCTTTDIVNGHIDPLVRTLEVSVTPKIQQLGCIVVDALTRCALHLLIPHYPQILFYITHHLEQPYIRSHRLHFMRTAEVLLTQCGVLYDSLLPSRLARAVLPSVTCILAHKSDLQSESEASGGSAKSRKGKKRARGYEGDEVFKMTRGAICATPEDGEVVLAALNVLKLLLSTGPLSPAVHSLVARVMLSLYLTIPHIPPTLLSFDLSLHSKLNDVVMRICVALGSGTTSTTSKSLGLVVGTSVQSGTAQTFADLDLLLHPRVPPLVRSLPHVEMLSLFRAEEGQEESDTRQALHLGANHESQNSNSSIDTTEQSTLAQTAPTAPPIQLPPLSTVRPAISGQVDPTRVMARPVEAQPPSLVANPSPASKPAQVASVPAPNQHQYVATTSIQPPVRTLGVDLEARITPVDIQMVPDGADDDDEPMPSIDADSDSDEDDSA
ncbi:rRNA processing/ribosome biogenesis-domain-containing protein [Cristinia sonorae]|uniref:Pre-rRNA-processing protein RIX1 n=1 Tax=Cristinia sonorae TaxID=1940300 RepID=A0A8K0UKT0_9AGAR|nr:rRNA processing/ribosome biogenesis-domain-containing protein [Cristinia sonorae]